MSRIFFLLQEYYTLKWWEKRKQQFNTHMYLISKARDGGACFLFEEFLNFPKCMKESPRRAWENKVWSDCWGWRYRDQNKRHDQMIDIKWLVWSFQLFWEMIFNLNFKASCEAARMLICGLSWFQLRYYFHVSLLNLININHLTLSIQHYLWSRLCNCQEHMLIWVIFDKW